MTSGRTMVEQSDRPEAHRAPRREFERILVGRRPSICPADDSRNRMTGEAAPFYSSRVRLAQRRVFVTSKRPASAALAACAKLCSELSKCLYPIKVPW